MMTRDDERLLRAVRQVLCGHTGGYPERVYPAAAQEMAASILGWPEAVAEQLTPRWRQAAAEVLAVAVLGLVRA